MPLAVARRVSGVKLGRPRVPIAQRRGTRLTLVVTENEASFIQRCADDRGVTLSDFLRNAALYAANERMKL